MTQTCGEPLRLLRKAMRRPSGENAGENAPPMRAIAPTLASRSSVACAELAAASAIARAKALTSMLSLSAEREAESIVEPATAAIQPTDPNMPASIGGRAMVGVIASVLVSLAWAAPHGIVFCPS